MISVFGTGVRKEFSDVTEAGAYGCKMLSENADCLLSVEIEWNDGVTMDYRCDKGDMGEIGNTPETFIKCTLAANLDCRLSYAVGNLTDTLKSDVPGLARIKKMILLVNHARAPFEPTDTFPVFEYRLDSEIIGLIDYEIFRKTAKRKQKNGESEPFETNQAQANRFQNFGKRFYESGCKPMKMVYYGQTMCYVLSPEDYHRLTNQGGKSSVKTGD